MNKTKEEFKLRHIYCPNCGYLLSGCENKEGITKYRCPKCNCVIVSKVVSRRKVIFEVTNVN